MREIAAFPDINVVKANFDSIYDLNDPREYFRVLGGLDYVIPDLANPLFRQLVEARAAGQSRPVTVLDLGCSYGINTALLRFPLTLDMLRRRYMLPEIAAQSPASIRELDVAYFRAWPPRSGFGTVGLDVSENAVRYAEDVGILDVGIAENFETADPSPAARAALEHVDIIVSTGCVGYVTEKTFERVLACNRNEQAPWVASFVLRMFPYDRVRQKLAREGLETEKFEGASFVQRRFRDADEYDDTLTTLEKLGIDPTGFEAEGLFHAEFFLSRPKHEIESRPLGNLVSVVSGRHKRYGRRYMQVPGRGRKLLQH